VPVHRRRLTLLTVPLILAASFPLAACSQGADAPSSGSSTAPSPALTYSAEVVGADGGPVQASPGTGTLGPGFVTPTAPPPPGGTMSPSPGSWSGVHVPAGYTAVLLSTDDSEPARNLAAAVKTWAERNHVALTSVPAHDPAGYVTAIQRAIDLHPDLVISAGDPLADPLALVTSAWLDQKFLLLGAELAEPTANVTAATWKGTSARGGGSANAESYDASTFTQERGGRALEAGVAAVLRGYSGYVVRVD
jgi:hypothetical protein